MANASYQDINPADEQKFFGVLTPQSQFLYSRIKKKTAIFSAKKIHNLTGRSFLPLIASTWAGLTAPQKAFWTTVGAYSGLNGYRAFTAETSIRLKLGLSVPNVPAITHLAWIGHLNISGSATQIKIAQEHPSAYYVHKKVVGKKGLYAPVLVQESMSLPLQIGISYKSNLTATGATQRARFYAILRSSYQGVDRENLVEIPFNAVQDWSIETASISQTLGHFIGYTLYIELYGYTGDLYFDNVKVVHSSVNWARDKNCSNIKQAFSNQYYQIPNHWVALELPSGAVYDSDYVDS